MEFHVLHADLKKALVKLLDATPRKNQYAVPVLHHISLVAEDDELTLTAFNGAISVTTEINAQIKEPDACTILYHRFRDYVNSFKEGQFRFRLNEERTRVCLTCGKSRAQIPSMDIEEFPVVGQDKGSNGLKLDVEKFVKALNLVNYAVSTDKEGREVLTGVHILYDGTHILFESADGYRLSSFTIDLTEQDAFEGIIPGTAMASLAKILKGEEGNVTITTANKGNTIVFETFNYVFTSQLLDGVFPDVQRIIPTKSTTTLVTDRKALLDSVKRIMIMSRDYVNMVRVAVDQDSNTLHVFTPQYDIGWIKNPIPATIKGDNLEFNLSGRFLISVLDSLKTEEVEFGMTNNTSPIKILGIGEDDFSHVIMPMIE